MNTFDAQHCTCTHYRLYHPRASACCMPECECPEFALAQYDPGTRLDRKRTGDERMSDVTVGLQRERVRVVHEVPGYYWRCEQCGWLGTGCGSLDFAMAEAGRHADKTHGLRNAVVTRVDWATPDVAYDAERSNGFAIAPARVPVDQETPQPESSKENDLQGSE